MAKTFVSDEERLRNYIESDIEFIFSCSENQIHFKSRGLDELPWDISCFSNLKFVNLAINNFTEIPECIRSLKNLESLEMRRNMLNNIPEWISELKEMRFLDLRYNKGITKIPIEISKMKNIMGIYLGFCNIDTVPDSIYKIKTLRRFFLSNNKLTNLPLCHVERDECEELIIDIRNNDILSLEGFPKIQRVEIYI